MDEMNKIFFEAIFIFLLQEETNFFYKKPHRFTQIKQPIKLRIKNEMGKNINLRIGGIILVNSANTIFDIPMERKKYTTVMAFACKIDKIDEGLKVRPSTVLFPLSVIPLTY